MISGLQARTETLRLSILWKLFSSSCMY